MVRHRPPHDAPAENVEHHGQEHEPRLSRHVGDVGHREPVRGLGLESALDQVRRRTPARLRTCRARTPAPAYPPPAPVHASAVPRAYGPPRAPEPPARHEPEALHRSRANARGSPEPHRAAPHSRRAMARTPATHPRMVPAGGDTQHPAHRGHPVLGSVSLLTSPKTSRAPCRSPERTRAAAFFRISRSLAKLAILPAQPPQLLALGARQSVLATPFIAVRLTHPVAHRLRRALELPSQLPGRATCPHQSDAHTIWRRYSGA